MESTYSVNRLNQYAKRTMPNQVDLLGTANPTADVTVRVEGGTIFTAGRKGEYYDDALTVGNNVYPQVEVKSPYGATQAQSNRVFNPPSTGEFVHHVDGNLTQDGRWTCTWDAENRLIQITPLAAMPEADKRRGNYAYDHQGRRIWKRVDQRSGGNWVTHSERKFLYDQWNLMVELFANNDTPAKRFHWGLDLSGTEQGAGGIGGLLKVWDHYTGNHCFVGYDGNGNVMALVLGHSVPGIYRAQFEYGPFGEPIRSSGTTTLGATDHRGMPLRFSTKYTDWESDLVYYGYRYYNPSTGRWPNRDPIGEFGGLNLYGFVGGDSISRNDRLGLYYPGYHPRAIPGIDYWAEGQAYRDPLYLSLWVAWDSGLRPGTKAWYTSYVRYLGNDRGICNSPWDTSSPITTSFVRSHVVNNTLCCKRIRASCEFVFRVKTWVATEKTGGQIVRLSGHLLGKRYSEDFHAIPASGETVLHMAYSKPFSGEFEVRAGGTHEIYFISPTIAFTPAFTDEKGIHKVGGSFHEALTASCRAKVVGSCRSR